MSSGQEVCSKIVEEFAMDTPIGLMKMEICPDGIHYISLEDDTDGFKPDSEKPVTLSEHKEGNEDIAQHCHMMYTWFQKYFKNSHSVKVPDLRTVCCSAYKDSFYWNVWSTLAEAVAPGTTISYSQLAVLCGRSKGAAMAVGNAVALNPYLIVVPCHRVINKNGNLGKYRRSSQNYVKEWLLNYENAKISFNGI